MVFFVIAEALLILTLNILRQVSLYRTDPFKAPKPYTILDLKLIFNFVIRMRVYLGFK